MGLIGAIFAAGLVGGLVNALLAEKGLRIWQIEHLPDGGTIIRPGFVGNMLIGGVAAVVMVLAYYPPATAGSSNPIFSPQQLLGALAAGVGGARILSQEVDRRFDRASQKKLGGALRNTKAPQ